MPEKRMISLTEFTEYTEQDKNPVISVGSVRGKREVKNQGISKWPMLEPTPKSTLMRLLLLLAFNFEHFRFIRVRGE